MLIFSKISFDYLFFCFYDDFFILLRDWVCCSTTSFKSFVHGIPKIVTIESNCRQVSASDSPPEDANDTAGIRKSPQQSKTIAGAGWLVRVCFIESPFRQPAFLIVCLEQRSGSRTQHGTQLSQRGMFFKFKIMIFFSNFRWRFSLPCSLLPVHMQI